MGRTSGCGPELPARRGAVVGRAEDRGARGPPGAVMVRAFGCATAAFGPTTHNSRAGSSAFMVATGRVSAPAEIP